MNATLEITDKEVWVAMVGHEVGREVALVGQITSRSPRDYVT